ncbi:hypothetical protein [Janthinobacterium sp. 67]|uniref:hypothetical protein n=1 Tax=Janthinobacterium sp. 67 TaxID=2035207 RepID=UPI000C238DE5|nr:hypothetical protein [Janthinobacterium sp. 67]
MRRGVLASVFLGVSLMGHATTPLQSDVSLQLVNADPHVAIRIYLDRKLVYQGMPSQGNAGDSPSVPVKVGTFSLDKLTRHTIIAEVVGSPIKSQVEWAPNSMSSNWAVISYYRGREKPAEPAFFGIAFQKEAYKTK